MTKQIAYAICLVAFTACQAKPKLDVEFAAKDLAPPQVVSITPANGATEVTDKPTIVIVFNERMDAATLNSSTVTLRTPNGTAGVGSYEYDDTTRALTIKIVESLFLNTQYTLTITSLVKDRAGNAMSPVTSTFSTDVCPKAKAAKPVFNGAVYTLAKLGCTIYVGGQFTQVGLGNSYGTAVDGTTGQTVPGFDLLEINGWVRTAVPDGAGGFYIGGDFTRISGVTRNRLAHIASNGELLPWNPDANGSVYALAVSGSTIYAGGEFTTISGNTRNYLAAIGTDGTLLSWNPNASNYVRALAVSGTSVYVGGDFTTIGGNTRNRLAAIGTDGTLLSWNPNASGSVHALVVSGTTVYVGGGFTTIGGNTRYRLAAIGTDGTLLSWNPNADLAVLALAVSGTSVYVGGDFTTIGGNTRNHLAAIGTDGSLSTWNPNANNTVYALAVSGSTIYAGGGFTCFGTCPTGIENSTKWSRNRLAAIGISGNILSWNPNASDVVLALAVSGSTLYAGGLFTTMGSTTRNYLAAIGTDGTLLSWNPNASSFVHALAVSGSTVYAGGSFTTIGGTGRNRLAAIGADGSLLSWNPNADNWVSALALSGSTIYAGGGFTCFGTCPTGTENITKWSRNRLAAIGISGNILSWNPNASGFVNALAVSGTTVYVGGDFTMIGGNTHYRLAAIDGSTDCLNSWSGGCITTWNPSADDAVRSLAVSGTTVYVGGDFTTLSGNTRNYLAAIDGSTNCLNSWNGTCITTWNPNANSSVLALAVSGTTIYAGGGFTTLAGGTNTRNRLAAIGINGSLLDWNPNASGFVNALAVSGATVYAGGHFTEIGSNSSFRLASINADGSVNW